MFKIHYASYYSIDKETKTVELLETEDLKKNIHIYIEEHLSTLYSEDTTRAYIIKANQSTDVINHINSILTLPSNKNSSDKSDKIAQRLLKAELEAQKKIAQMQSELQRGGLILTHFQAKNGQEYFVAAKIHFIDVRMEATFRKAKATPDKEHMLKTVIMPVHSNSVTLENKESTAFVTDSTKSKGSLAATFWWDNFLQLTTARNDKDNTTIAINKFDRYLKKSLFHKNKMDYYNCSGNILAYMRTSDSFVLDDAIKKTIGDVETFNFLHGKSELEKKKEIEKMRGELKSLTKDRSGNIHFDSNFSINRKVVNNKSTQTIRLNESMTLKFERDIEDLRSKISTGTDANGKYIKIYSDKGYEEFTDQ